MPAVWPSSHMINYFALPFIIFGQLSPLRSHTFPRSLMGTYHQLLPSLWSHKRRNSAGQSLLHLLQHPPAPHTTPLSQRPTGTTLTALSDCDDSMMTWHIFCLRSRPLSNESQPFSYTHQKPNSLSYKNHLTSGLGWLKLLLAWWI